MVDDQRGRDDPERRLTAGGDLADLLPTGSLANDPDLDQQMVALEGQQQRLLGVPESGRKVSTSESWTRAASSTSIVRKANAPRAAATVSGWTGSTSDAIRRSSSSSGSDSSTPAEPGSCSFVSGARPRVVLTSVQRRSPCSCPDAGQARSRSVAPRIPRARSRFRTSLSVSLSGSAATGTPDRTSQASSQTVSPSR